MRKDARVRAPPICSGDFRVECQSTADLELKHRMQEAVMYKRQRSLIPLYIRVSEISYILYIFYRGYFNLYCMVNRKNCTILTILFFVSGCCLILEGGIVLVP